MPGDWPLLPGSSPPTRGARTRLRRREATLGIIPAYAGSTSPRTPTTPTGTDHPRLRGEHSTTSAGVAPGWIIPAYAGSTRPAAGGLTWTRDHPRLRGEHESDSCDKADIRGSSPPTRGAQLAHQLVNAAARIIPAYAGSTTRSAGRPASGRDHPRLRGEHVPICGFTTSPSGSSPPTRGAQRPLRHQPARPGSSPPTRGALAISRVHSRDARIIPAYAGSTPTRRSTLCGPRDHPRLRGEHLPPVAPVAGADGSSPPTRGARGRKHHQST